MTADTDDADDGQLEELQEHVEALEGASETLAETTDTVQERAEDTLGEGGDSLFDGVDDAAGEASGDTVVDMAVGPTSLFPSRERLLGVASGALPLCVGVTVLGISVVPLQVSLFLAGVTVLEVTLAAVTQFREYLFGDVAGGALIGLVVGSLGFLFAYLGELAAGAI